MSALINITFLSYAISSYVGLYHLYVNDIVEIQLIQCSVQSAKASSISFGPAGGLTFSFGTGQSSSTNFTGKQHIIILIYYTVVVLTRLVNDTCKYYC